MNQSIRPTLRPTHSPWKSLEFYINDTRGRHYYIRTRTNTWVDFTDLAGLLDRISQPGRLEAVQEFLNQLDELER